jgi:MFS family permease
VIRRLLLPKGADSSAMPLLVGRALRAFADGYVAILLPAYLLTLGFGTWEVGLIASATLLGSAMATLAVGAWGHRFHSRGLLLGAAGLMAATGLAFAAGSSFWPLLVIAFVGTLNPSSGDVSVFVPLEHARLAGAAHSDARTALFARYSLLGALFAALGALAAALPDRLVTLGVTNLDALRAMFVLYGLVGCAVWLLYRRLPAPDAKASAPPAPLRHSRSIVWKLAALFSVDSFAGGLVVNSLLALWLFQRFQESLSATAAFFFWAGLLTAFSQLAAPPGQARRPPQHHGLHSHTGQPLSYRRGVLQSRRSARVAAATRAALADGRSRTRRIRHGRGCAGGEGRCSKLYRSATQPRVGNQSRLGRGVVYRGLAGCAAGGLRAIENRLRRDALANLPRDQIAVTRSGAMTEGGSLSTMPMSENDPEPTVTVLRSGRRNRKERPFRFLERGYSAPCRKGDMWCVEADPRRRTPSISIASQATSQCQ